MDDLNKNEIQVVEQSAAPKDKKPKSKLKGFLSMVAAGAVGSVLTMTVIPQTDFFHDYYQPVAEGSENVAGAATQGNEVNIMPTSTNNSSASVADIVDQTASAIVGIINRQQQNNPFSRTSEVVESGSGSGVIFKKTDDVAYIVTNNHVIEGASEIEVSLHNGEKVTAQLIGADALTDLAVLKIDAKYADNVLSFGDSSTLRAGDQVLAIGNPLGLEFSRTVTQGIVSAVDRNIAVSTSAGEWELNVIQTDAAINPGNSGGALINSQGQVIGINSLKISESGVEGLGFAIPSNDVVPIVNEIIESGKISRPYMGVSLASLNEIPPAYYQNLPDDVTGGVMVTYVDPNSAAAEAGIKAQDIIVSINEQKVETASELRKYLYTEAKIGDEVKLEIYREGKLIKEKITLSNNIQAS
ncbi:trypsin-like peptidase domain-containing protein [Robertmurraya sp. DFI.2.37]|uniref:S1C family serine protease n=1 Tax=Robertmurraya sp. DFI.2.37 TaxID=3031819 RepID=UPI0012461F61|nr:trypsin-like peptidase domain-containing protein [Robertmurraya sp. DFI.2.37]MDF1509248.1 trypsin-like peptidase domain-containing protein [Robertmurraya sp. DFI.2.37]